MDQLDALLEKLKEHVCEEDRDCDQARGVLMLWRNSLVQIRRWVVLHRNGDLSASRAFDEIMRDVERCLPRSTADG
jgi:hypothetical protein